MVGATMGKLAEIDPCLTMTGVVVLMKSGGSHIRSTSTSPSKEARSRVIVPVQVAPQATVEGAICRSATVGDMMFTTNDSDNSPVSAVTVTGRGVNGTCIFEVVAGNEAVTTSTGKTRGDSTCSTVVSLDVTTTLTDPLSEGKFNTMVPVAELPQITLVGTITSFATAGAHGKSLRS